MIADGSIKAIYNEAGNTSGPNWGGSTHWDSFTWTSSITGATPLYLHQDHLGSVVAISGSSGSVVERDAYDPWGKRRNTNGTDDAYDALSEPDQPGLYRTGASDRRGFDPPECTRLRSADRQVLGDRSDGWPQVQHAGVEPVCLW